MRFLFLYDVISSIIIYNTILKILHLTLYNCIPLLKSVITSIIKNHRFCCHLDFIAIIVVYKINVLNQPFVFNK